MAIPPSFIQELLARADVVDIVGRYVPLKKGGANFMGLCPFHSEKSPSFTVSPSKQFYHCFGCGKNGNAIGFMMDHVGMSFVEAVHDLAQQYGLQVPQDDVSPQERERAAQQRQKQTSLSDVLEKAGEAYRRLLKDSPRAVAYFKQRGVSGEVARAFGLGYAPEGWRSLASVFPDYTEPLLVEAGLVILNQEEGGEEKRYDRFRDRVMFPIRNVKGECIGFGGRVLGDGTPKYLNSPETPVFSKGRELYGLFEARAALREQGYALVTEGYMDVVALAQLGFPNAVATLGTACTAEHVQKLFRFTDAVVFSFDGDGAGRRAARKALDAALPHANDTRSVKFLFLPPEHDPDSFIRANGQQAFAEYVNQAVPLSQFLLDAASEGCELSSAEGRAKMSSHAKPLWSALPDGALKRQLLGELAAKIQLSARELSELWQIAPSAPPVVRHAPAAPPEFGEAPPPSYYSKNSYERPTGEGKRPFWSKNANGKWRPAAPPQIGPRVRPASRADHAARLLLSAMQLWETLSQEDHVMLCEQAEPHGPLFQWLDQQSHEHGSQPWAALREGLRGQDAEELALRLMGGAEALSMADEQETRDELRGVLDLMLDDWLKPQETAALLASRHDAEMRQKYYDIAKRRQELRLAIQATKSSNTA